MSANDRSAGGIQAFERLRDRARRSREYAETYIHEGTTSQKFGAMSPEEVTLTFAEIDAADELLKSIVERHNRATDSHISFMSYKDYEAKYGNPKKSVWESISESSRLVAMWCEFAITQIAGIGETTSTTSHHTYFGAVHMGDVFQGVINSTIVSRSTVERAFNQLQSDGRNECAALLVEIGKRVSEANNPAASAVYSQMAQELSKPSHDKGLLKSFWDGLVAILPPLATLSATVIKAFAIPA